MKAKDFDFNKRPLSYSSLKHFAKSPIHFVEYLTADKVDVPAFAFGRLVDAMLFEEETVKAKFITKPKFDKRKKGEKEAEEQWLTSHDKMTFLSEEDFQKAERMVESLKTNPLSKRIIDNTSVTQEKLNWTDKKTGLPVIQYTDGRGEFSEKEPFIWDLKTAQDASTEKFSRDAYNFDYHLQAGLYLEGYKRKRFVFPSFYHVVVEKVEPFSVNVLRATDDFLELGKQEVRKLLDEVAYCLKEDRFHQGHEFRCTNDKYNILDLPGWAKSKLD